MGTSICNNISKNISKNLSSKYSQELLENAKNLLQIQLKLLQRELSKKYQKQLEIWLVIISLTEL